MEEHHPKKLLDQVRDAIRLKHYSYLTEQAYVGWSKRYIYFHNVHHPAEMGAAEVEAFLTHLAVKENVAASTQNQALSALLFLYREVLHQDLGPLVYGSGIRLMECLRLRVKDLEFERRALIVRDGKGAQDRATILPDSLMPLLQEHLRRVKALNEQDLAQGYGAVYLPDALARKYPNADREWDWQYVFPASSLSQDPRSGVTRRHHLHESSLQKTVKEAARQAGMVKPVGPHTLRHCFATHLLEAHYDIRTVQELLGHKDVKTTMIYTRVLNRGGLAVRSPLD